MKRIALVSALIILLCTAFRFGQDKTITIEDAVKHGLIKFKLTGKGGYSGECLSLELQNLKSKDITVKIEAGRRFNSNDENEQDLLVVREQAIVVKGGSRKKINVNGFCCQLHNSAPDVGSGFAVGLLAEDRLVKLAKYISEKKLPQNIIQEAIWCVSDDQSPSNISVEEDAEDSELKKQTDDLRKFVCDLKGIKDTWYSTPQKRVQTPQREIQSNPVEIYGAIKYEVKSSTVINSELQDVDHKTLFTMPGKNVMQKGEWDYNFHLKLDGFEKGTYHVILKAGNVQIMDKEFVVS